MNPKTPSSSRKSDFEMNVAICGMLFLPKSKYFLFSWKNFFFFLPAGDLCSPVAHYWTLYGFFCCQIVVALLRCTRDFPDWSTRCMMCCQNPSSGQQKRATIPLSPSAIPFAPPSDLSLLLACCFPKKFWQEEKRKKSALFNVLFSSSYLTFFLHCLLVLYPPLHFLPVTLYRV